MDFGTGYSLLLTLPEEMAMARPPRQGWAVKDQLALGLQVQGVPWLFSFLSLFGQDYPVRIGPHDAVHGERLEGI